MVATGSPGWGDLGTAVLTVEALVFLTETTELWAAHPDLSRLKHENLETLM